MKTHTPGPWHVMPQPGQIVGVHKYTHCVMYGDDCLASLLTEPDAHLIAAAPDLLSFARECARADSDCGEGVRQAARAAIAKAEGH